MADASSSTNESEQPSTSKRPIVPAASFADVLKDLSKDDDSTQEESRWARPTQQQSDEAKPPITFQKLDIRESNTESAHSEIQLFGITKTGHSILTRVLNFEHYFYYPAPEGFRQNDLEPLRDYLNKTVQGKSSVVSNIELEDQSITSDGKPLPFLKINLSDHRFMWNIKDKV
ncbi:unnamed protein product [Cyclocybe aegerita]|uniref:Uncharacterized protein n=1 Tax=Cyclocybe aegerita TaxID=1973307 RepID=A0A8S0XQG6_CYCAE|nr:unnamed protein product [Cyclocybe aegerita]